MFVHLYTLHSVLINSIADKILKHNIFLMLLIPEKKIKNKPTEKNKTTEKKKNSSGVSHSEKKEKS